MTNQNDFVKRLARLFDKIEIPYMISGSVGSSFHGWPRATNDADIVIEPTDDQLNLFIRELSEDYYISSDAAVAALKHKTMFNIIDIKDGWKADIIIRKDRPFSRQEFKRRQRAGLFEDRLWILSAEDAILSKLEWANQSKSQRQLEDALGVAVVQWKKLDLEYLRRWATELQICSQLDKLLKQAKEKSDQDKSPDSES